MAVGVAVYVAMTYQSYWALLLGTFTDIKIRAIGSFVIYPYRPRLSSHNFKTQWDFSKWLIPQALVGLWTDSFRHIYRPRILVSSIWVHTIL